jgi:hypothetical protein
VCASKEQHKGNKNFVSSVSRSYESWRLTYAYTVSHPQGLQNIM